MNAVTKLGVLHVSSVQRASVSRFHGRPRSCCTDDEHKDGVSVTPCCCCGPRFAMLLIELKCFDHLSFAMPIRQISSSNEN